VITVKKYHLHEIQDEYYQWHDLIFGKDPYHVPIVVYFGYDKNNNFIGFMSGYYHDKRTFYIQKIAINPEMKGKGLSAALSVYVLDTMKKEDVRYILGQIENTNIPMIIASVKAGCLINGYFTDTNGKQYIRIIKDLGEK